ncbi:hypothetical protein D6827_03105, partial [Candidatus Parcubacteria bacterium]
GNKYLFAERNKEDSDYAAIIERLRKKNIRFIQENIPDKEQQLSLMLAEMRRVYSIEEITQYVSTDKYEWLVSAFNSFKINNPDIDLEEFGKLVDMPKLQEIGKILNELEAAETGKKKAAGK